jgi:hypothetical protein
MSELFEKGLEAHDELLTGDEVTLVSHPSLGPLAKIVPIAAKPI